MEGSFSCVLGITGRDDGPKLTVSGSFVIAANVFSHVGTVIGNIQVLVFFDVFDSVHIAFLFEDEALVGCAVEAVHDEVAVVGLILGDI